MRYPDTDVLYVLCAISAIPSLSLLVTGRCFREKASWRDSITAALVKWGITVAFITLAFIGLPKWLAEAAGAAIALSATVCGGIGALILVFSGFWDEPRSVRGIAKWSIIGGAAFFVSLSIGLHPFEMAKTIAHFQDDQSQDE